MSALIYIPLSSLKQGVGDSLPQRGDNKSTTLQMWATKRDAIKASGADIMAQLSQAVDAQGASPMLQATMLPLTPCIQSPLHASLWAEQHLTAPVWS